MKAGDLIRLKKEYVAVNCSTALTAFIFISASILNSQAKNIQENCSIEIFRFSTLNL